ncbi:CDP-alcohol phosphatidyltransferase family protein [Aestuariivirga litoralis]|uniref:CDP-alcohol phosphatidyltransferase family protein n=1 Tax=Aestuariivirga litoralis TaxID=2650924 RepID=UPI0018C6ABB8|nr:phosphatidylcholine/phosphatidylserine synthase [Aestuariivirga litoralis]
MPKLQIKPSLEHEIKKGVAWSVHAFTASGIVLGFLALVSVLKNDAVAAFMWLGLALFVDGVDGTLARRARVKEYTPNFDGGSLDLVIDFFTYVAVPALMIYWFDMVPAPFWFGTQTWSLIMAALIMAVSLYTFANVNMKSFDYYFVGFPAIWNVVVLYFYLFNTGWVVNFITIIGLSILTFIPVKFVHPLRVTLWRNVTVPMTVLWAALTLSLVISGRNPDYSDWSYKIQLFLFGFASLYFAGISLWRTFVVGDKEEEHE